MQRANCSMWCKAMRVGMWITGSGLAGIGDVGVRPRWPAVGMHRQRGVQAECWHKRGAGTGEVQA